MGDHERAEAAHPAIAHAWVRRSDRRIGLSLPGCRSSHGQLEQRSGGRSGETCRYARCHQQLCVGVRASQ